MKIILSLKSHIFFFSPVINNLNGLLLL